MNTAVTEFPEVSTAFDTLEIGPYKLGGLKPYLREIILDEIRQNGVESIRKKWPVDRAKPVRWKATRAE